MAKTATAAKKPVQKKPEAAPPAAPHLQVVPDGRPACRTCPFWLARAQNGNLCKRFPNAVIKGPEDWCGEHPFFQVTITNVSSGPDIRIAP